MGFMESKQLSRSFCNPLDLSYKYQHNPTMPSCREGADPTLVLFKGTYYLFVSMSGGFWYSEDLISWIFHENREINIYDYAPDACEIDGMLYLTASRNGNGNVVLCTEDPLSDRFTEIKVPFSYWDPAVFHDDDGRTYLYWGCSNMNPIYGVEIDSKTFRKIDETHPLIEGNEEINGYERAGENGIVKCEGPLFQMRDLFYDKETKTAHLPDDFPVPEGMTREILEMLIPAAGRPYLEGAFMTKHDGRYFLQYSSPGTEFNTYCNAVYVSDNPLGPYKMQASNPFSAKPGGFICGAGHGSTLLDKYGNYWHITTMRVSVNQGFERRLGLFPAGFDEDGVLYCNQNFGDYPVEIPEGKFDPKSLHPKWMLLSYKKPVTASCTAEGSRPEFAVNEDNRSWWSAGSADESAWLCVDLEKMVDVRAIQVNFADENVHPDFSEDMYVKNGYETRYIEATPQKTCFTLEASEDGADWKLLENIDGDRPNAYFVYPNGLQVRYIRVSGWEFPYGQPMRISGLRVFGNGGGEKPEAVANVTAERIGQMNAIIRWKQSKNSLGYNVRYGIAPDKLYLSWLVYDDCEVNLSTLIAGQDYYVCVDSFNENGVTSGAVRKICPQNFRKGENEHE